ncbi:Serine/threonine-protein kinase Nek4 [Desmophyllum pertusum]|uniref:non-specific serine/threonine protein kinase n=1 Tax=Desmophyllum pertusum TaxID=174260 RepID=A0A9W9ZWN5_9CNID|nr:Serine/threonine-protein kinase Nek4 [Desmophyllum pertusum]
MHFCEGGDLYHKAKAHSKEGKVLEETQVVEWFVQIAMALQLGDLGIARVLETSSDMANTLIGTPYYMSPELFSNKPYNYKSDVWALGCCLYEMCTLRHAFNAKDMSSLVTRFLKESSDLCGIVQSMLELEPAKRPSADAFYAITTSRNRLPCFWRARKTDKSRKLFLRKTEFQVLNQRLLKHNRPSQILGIQVLVWRLLSPPISAVDCVLEDEKPAKKSPKPSSRNEQERSSVDSTSSSSGSSPRARRRYKVTSSSHAARSHYAEEEEEEEDEDDRSTADSETRVVYQPEKDDGLNKAKGQGSAVGDPRRQLGQAEGFDTPDGARPIARKESSASIADSVEQDSDTDSELEEISLDGEPSVHAQRKPRRQSDVTSLISALDTTLKLSNGSIDRESPDVETVPEEPEETEPLDVPAFGGSPTTSGRLRDRIDGLRRECIRGIGEDLLIKALQYYRHSPRGLC